MFADLGGIAPTVLEAARVLVVLAAGLLLPAGVAKIRRPVDARDALGWRSARSLTLVRVIGAGELSLAAVTLLVGGWLVFAALAAAYLAFAAVALHQRRRGASCGCFGQASAPAGVLHVAINLVLALGSGLAAGAGAALGRPLALGLGPATTLAAGLLAVVGVVTVQQLLTALPDLRAATRRVTLPAPRAPRPDPAGGDIG